MPVRSLIRPSLATFFALLALLVSMVAPRAASAQCTPQWQPFDPSTASFPGTSGSGGVSATIMWDTDGPGPQTPKLVVGGGFTVAGNAVANNIAVYDPATGQWSPLGSGMSSGVNALAVLPNGDLVAGRGFTTAGGVSANRIARWNGSAWSPLGSSMNSTVRALAVLPGGDLVAGGFFTTAGGVVAPFLARWGCVTPTCDSLDFNTDGDFPTPLDLEDFINAVAGNVCGTCSTDLDFNNDGDFPTPLDVEAFISVNAGGPCL